MHSASSVGARCWRRARASSWAASRERSCSSLVAHHAGRVRFARTWNKCIDVAPLRDEFFLEVTAEPSATGSILLQPPRAAGNRDRTATQGPPDRHHACATRGGRFHRRREEGNYRRPQRLPRPRGSRRDGRRRTDARGERATDRPHGYGRGSQGRAFAPTPPNLARPLRGRSLRGHLRGQCGVLQGQLQGNCGQLRGSCGGAVEVAGPVAPRRARCRRRRSASIL